jgi:hypothetical protein
MKCKKCKKNKTMQEFAPAYSPFWLDGHIDICYDCLGEMVDYSNLNEVDRLCQYANMAFLPEDWRKMFKREGDAAFRKYANIYNEINYYKYDWGQQNEALKVLAEEGVVELEIEELRPSKLKELRLKWGDVVTESDLVRMERYFNRSLSEWAITKETEKDQLRKIVRLSVMMDNNLATGKPDKDLLGMYDKLVTQLHKTVGNKQQVGYNSLSQLTAFIERNGYKPQFYDGVPRDEIDMMMNDIQSYLRDLVSSEVNFEEMLERAIEKKRKRDNPKSESEDTELGWGDEDEKE